MDHKTPEEIARDKERIASLKSASADMAAAVSLTESLQSALIRTNSDLEKLRRALGDRLHVRLFTNHGKEQIVGTDSFLKEMIERIEKVL